MPATDGHLVVLMGIVCALALATASGRLIAAFAHGESAVAFAENWQARVEAWWWIAAIGAIALVLGPWALWALFATVSFLALREYLASSPFGTRDHSLVVMALGVAVPVQYGFVASGNWIFAVAGLPILAFSAGAARLLCRDFSAAARIGGGLLVCVWGISFAAMPLFLRVEGSSGDGSFEVLFLVLLAQACDVFQFLSGKLFGRHRIAPRISPRKTWEGLIGGLVCAAALGAALHWMTPFSAPRAGAVALLIGFAGFAGGLALSVVKRRRCLKDWGTLLPGHGGVLDRVDSLWLSAPVYVLGLVAGG